MPEPHRVLYISTVSYYFAYEARNAGQFRHLRLFAGHASLPPYLHAAVFPRASTSL